MIMFTENSEVWEKLFAFLFDIYYFIFDVIWNTKIPLTDITIAYWLIFWMVVKLSIFAINGTSTNYNDITNSISAGARSAVKTYSSVAKYSKNKKAKKESQRIAKEKRDSAPVKKFVPNAKRPVVNQYGERINNFSSNTKKSNNRKGKK